jgi:hypothetical protein
MLTRRELAAAAWYGAMFSAVVGWAMLRRGPAAGPALRAGEGIGDERGELRRVVHRVAGP